MSNSPMPTTVSTTPLAPLDRRVKDAATALRDSETKLTQVQREAQVAQRRLERARARLAEVETEKEALAAAKNEANEWIRRRSRSYSYLLIKELEGERDALAQDVGFCRQVMGEGSPIDQDKLSVMSRRFVRRLIWATAIVLIILAIILGVKYGSQPSTTASLPFVSWPLWMILLTAFVVWLLFVLRIMFSYHRDWSQQVDRLRRHQHEINHVFELLPHTRSEFVRLRDLHPQVQDRLDLIAESLYRPWIIDSRLDIESADPPVDSMPALMQLASVPLGRGGRKEEELRRRAIAEFIIKPGWRAAAYAGLLRCVEEIEDRPAGTLTADAVDQSPVALAAVRASLQSPDSRVLNARLRQAEVALDVQRRIIPDVHPLVASLRPDELADLDVRTELVTDPNADLTEWDDFLVRILGAGTSWSPAVFTEIGRSRGVSGAPRAFAFGPKRLQGRQNAEVTYGPLPDAGTRPLDLLVRVDVSGWCSPEDLMVFSTVESSQVQVAVAADDDLADPTGIL
ncbi:MAG: hypothetical protein NTZ03_02245 [Actinobacteria bacterium]|nr:hypothetical protein [Actinomycetota bacterium]